MMGGRWVSNDGPLRREQQGALPSPRWEVKRKVNPEFQLRESAQGQVDTGNGGCHDPGLFRDAQEVMTTPWVNMVTFLQLALSSLLPPTGLKAEAGSELPSSKMNTSQESAWG